jgi:hypothetical protein
MLWFAKVGMIEVTTILETKTIVYGSWICCEEIRIKEPLVLGISKPWGNYSVFMKEPTSFYSSRVPRYHENFNWQVSSGSGGGFMKWEQTTGNIYLYIFGMKNQQRTNVA